MNAQQFKQKVVPLRENILHVAKKMLENENDAKDLTQEVLLKLWSLRDTLHRYDSIPALAVTMIKNLCIDRLRVCDREVAFVIPNPLNAQQDLQINKVFEQYGKKKGVVMVQLTKEMLHGYDFSLFKSIVIKNNTEAVDFTRKCIEKDQEGAKKIKQVVQNGEVTSIVLELAPRGKENRLILYNESPDENKEMTLIYIESEMNAEKIMTTILKKK